MLTRVLILAILVSLFASNRVWAASQAPPAPQRLSLAEAVRLAQAQNPLTRETGARVSGANARLRGSAAQPNPTLSLAHAFGSSLTAGFDEDIVLAQMVEVGSKVRNRIRSAKFERDATLADRNDTALGLTYSVETAYYQALLADAEYRLASDTLEIVKRFAEGAQTQFQAGDVARSNVLRSEIELSQAEDELSATKTERTNQYAELANLIGFPASQAFTLTDKLEFKPLKVSLSDLQTLATHKRPDLQSARLTQNSLAAAVNATRAENQPDLFVEARHSDIDLSQGGSSIRAGLTMPIVDYGRTRADISSAKAALDEQKAKVDAATRAALLEVETSLHNLEQAGRVVQTFTSGRLDRARQLLDMAQTGYSRGASSYLELLDAQRVYQTEQVGYVRALAAYNTAESALNRAVGGKLR